MAKCSAFGLRSVLRSKGGESRFFDTLYPKCSMYGTVRIFTYIYHKIQLNVGKLVLNSHLDTFNNGYKSTSVHHLAFPSAKKTGMRTHLSHVFLWTKKTAGQSSHDSHARRQSQCRLTVATPNGSWELGLGEKTLPTSSSHTF